MEQPSVACFFNSRKRLAVEDSKINRAKKVLVLDSEAVSENSITRNVNENKSVQLSTEDKCKLKQKNEEKVFLKKVVTISASKPKVITKKNDTPKSVKSKNVKSKSLSSNHSIQDFISNMKSTTETEIPQNEFHQVHVTPPSTPTKIVNALDKVKEISEGPSIKEIRRKVGRSARLAELKASLSRFQEKDKQLKEIEKETKKIPESPKLKTFKTLDLEVLTSPKKVFSPEKSYLSPRKDSTVRRNLIHQFTPAKSSVTVSAESPSKKLLEETSKPALTLPYKYRYLAEIFRCIDIVSQLLFNRKETITFRKLKPAVEEMLKRNLTERHLSQIYHIYPDAFEFTQEKLKVFGTGTKQEQWELVMKPIIQNADQYTSEMLLERRRVLYRKLLDKTKNYHQEFLSTLDPPLIISKERITRWHPEFDIERVPDIELSELPKAPEEEKFTSGKDVLEKALQMFECNDRMAKALQKLGEKRNQQAAVIEEEPKPQLQSVLKGIPKALLERVRQKQSAKALLSMTRSADHEKELKLYSRLPELARLTRNVFVSEKKTVLPLDTLVEKLGNCYRSHLSKTEMEDHIRIICKEQPHWLVLHLIRNCNYLKIAKNDDINLIVSHFENLVKQKSNL